ncbi:putative Glucose-methanol-choline oxidoreductase N-terminal domain-containing protein [Seiridium cardinale]|uniref:Glucose-methanol-choline oxidoreductase N-terminal domain-containing protein n=1 Tax=Seiridium cardinale TaxID=138064 RepID=A0ABR2YA09_9PEZI
MVDLVADYIVVGGGLTGCTIASRISRNDNKPHVILLEAGSDATGNAAAAGFLSGMSLLGGKFDYAYQSEPVSDTANRVHSISSGKALGGGSILNFGTCQRADAADYDQWSEAVGDTRWSYQGLRPWLRKSEHFHGSATDADEHGFSGPMHVTSVSASESGQRRYPLREPVKAAWGEVGVVHNLQQRGGTIMGLTELHENSLDGMRQPSSTAYPLDDVKIYTDTVVHKVLFSEKTATGVELSDGRKVTARKEVVLCAGAYRTPQILLLSGIGPSATLSHHRIPILYDSPEVGQNLHDHFAVYFAFRLRDPSLGYALGSASWQNPSLFKYLPWDWVAMQNGRKETFTRCLLSIVPLAYLVSHLMALISLLQQCSYYLLPGAQFRSGLALLTMTQSFSQNYFATQLDRDTLIYAARQTLTLMLATSSMTAIVESETPPSGEGLEGLMPLTADASDKEIEDRIRRSGLQHYHSGGTAAMGKVVNTEGEVLGVHGLRIADASIIPIPLGGHPQATLYAMAEQLADMMMKDARKQFS